VQFLCIWPDVSKIPVDLLHEFKCKMPGFLSLKDVAEAAGVHPNTVYSTFDPNRRDFNERVFFLACDMLTTAIEQHNSRVSRYREELEKVAALEVYENE